MGGNRAVIYVMNTHTHARTHARTHAHKHTPIHIEYIFIIVRGLTHLPGSDVNLIFYDLKLISLYFLSTTDHSLHILKSSKLSL